MSMTLDDRSAPSHNEERVYRSLTAIILSFFEGHSTAPELQDAYLKRILKDFAPAAPKKTYKSRVKIATAADINRMWETHEKKHRRPKK